jgi:hypothetical protein
LTDPSLCASNSHRVSKPVAEIKHSGATFQWINLCGWKSLHASQ